MKLPPAGAAATPDVGAHLERLMTAWPPRPFAHRDRRGRWWFKDGRRPVPCPVDNRGGELSRFLDAYQSMARFIQHFSAAGAPNVIRVPHRTGMSTMRPFLSEEGP